MKRIFSISSVSKLFSNAREKEYPQIWSLEINTRLQMASIPKFRKVFLIQQNFMVCGEVKERFKSRNIRALLSHCKTHFHRVNTKIQERKYFTFVSTVDNFDWKWNGTEKIKMLQTRTFLSPPATLLHGTGSEEGDPLAGTIKALAVINLAAGHRRCPPRSGPCVLRLY